LVGWASNIQVGPSNEAEQSLSVELVADNPSLFAVQPKLDLETGNLTFTPAASASGKATISINLQDDGGTANGGQNSTTRVFTITLTNQNVTFVQHVYQDLLGRTGDAAGVVFWSTMLGQGVSRAQLSSNVQHSGEYFTHEASQLYTTYLRRAADVGGLANLSGLLAQGISVEQARAVLLGSTEYFQTQGGNSASGFVTALYHDVLQRDADAAGASLWATMLGLGVPRVTLALGILGSAEADRVFVSNSFQTLLGRPVDAPGLDAFVNALQNGLGDNGLIAALAASDEYFART
jgi:hypothetical protein